MILETQRLILRPWREEDAESLYEYAKDPRIGPIAGWPVHTSVENSKKIINSVLSSKECYAVTLKGEDKAIGSIELMIGALSNIKVADDEAEIGFWIGVPYWGQGLIPEAVRELMSHAFIGLGLKALWCGYFEGNIKSKRVQDKCGFKYQHTHEKLWKPLNEMRTEHITFISKQEWMDLNKIK